ncbi:MAG: DUF1501 domain-containing protein [Planctomycetaceae bacterium]
MLTRRRFLATSSVLAAGASAPVFWQRVAHAAGAADRPGSAGRALVIIELTGGNDGLNTVIPWRDPAYFAARPTLSQSKSHVLRISDELALHPSLAGLAKLWEQAQLAIVQGVGYPNPNRSHFESMDFWHTGTLKNNEPFGWLGQASTGMKASPAPVHVGSGSLPLALAGPSNRAISLRSLKDYQLRVSHGGDDPVRRRLVEGFAAPTAGSASDLLAFVRDTARETYASSARLRQVADSYDTPIAYPATGLAGRLRLIAQLISADVPERVFYTALEGFDTHANQAEQHARLLSELGDAVAAFQQDLTHQGQQRRVLTLTFSEFGRRVRENGSLGTDHGAASQMFVIGSQSKAGAIGAHPSLADLEDGDLKHHTDFRSVYATVLDQWLQVSSRDVLGGQFAPIEVLRPETS